MELLFSYLDPLNAILACGIIGISGMYWFILKQFISQGHQVQEVVQTNTAALTRIDGTLSTLHEKINLSLDRDRDMATALTKIETVLVKHQ